MFAHYILHKDLGAHFLPANMLPGPTLISVVADHHAGSALVESGNCKVSLYSIGAL